LNIFRWAGTQNISLRYGYFSSRKKHWFTNRNRFLTAPPDNRICRRKIPGVYCIFPTRRRVWKFFFF